MRISQGEGFVGRVGVESSRLVLASSIEMAVIERRLTNVGHDNRIEGLQDL